MKKFSDILECVNFLNCFLVFFCECKMNGLIKNFSLFILQKKRMESNDSMFNRNSFQYKVILSFSRC